MRKKSRKPDIGFSFTLIEILVVVTIIGLITVAGVVSYSQFVKQSRDAKRKADIENVRAALEMYKSNVGSYPGALPTLVAPTMYIKSIPKDPKTNENYSYTSDGSSYSLSTTLENITGLYSTNPYGSETLVYTPTPIPATPTSTSTPAPTVDIKVPTATPTGTAFDRDTPTPIPATPTPTSTPAPTIDIKVPTATPTGTAFE